MANKTKKRRYSGRIEKQLPRLLDLQLKTGMVVDAITRIVGVEAVRAELDKMMEEQREHEKAGTGGTQDTSGDAGAPGRTDQENSTQPTPGDSG